MRKYKFQVNVTFIDAIGDTDHNQCPLTRKSTSGGVIKIGDHSLMAWATTQTLPSLSSGESEWYGVNKTSAEGLGVKSGCEDFGDDYDLRVWTDSSAALGMGKKLGAGRL